ncbi:hypothetical protein DBR32_01570 [Taibaiella sp. KBW10]|uniref:hypothetical protein n=1 Tax=Taibaiella sp. KBW10 TaxID=2153357 RepID=UPI000F59B973|nr:hypothetical protein [Taibaiella sp. KBW10]RQO32324.1 hypothetical protein DBR32_01570 [Taibaiella sp. KBW10]
MKNTKSKATTLLAIALLGTGIISCKKAASPVPAKSKDEASSTQLTPVYMAGIMSWRYVASSQTVEFPYYQFYGLSTGIGFTGSTSSYDVSASSPKAFGATKKYKVFVYQNSNGGWFINHSFWGEHLLVNAGTGTLFNRPIDEVEINPATGETYAVVVNFSNVELYHLNHNTGDATLVGTLFNSAYKNRYKSGSIAFVPDGNGGYNMAFTHESGVYTANGLTMWVYNISGTTMSIAASYIFPTSGIPGAQTGNLNTTYGNGTFYIARDGGNLYSLPFPFVSNSVASLVLNASAYENKYDFGYWESR